MKTIQEINDYLVKSIKEKRFKDGEFIYDPNLCTVDQLYKRKCEWYLWRKLKYRLKGMYLTKCDVCKSEILSFTKLALCPCCATKADDKLKRHIE